jgi:hypothetical protein
MTTTPRRHVPRAATGSRAARWMLASCACLLAGACGGGRAPAVAPEALPAVTTAPPVGATTSVSHPPAPPATITTPAVAPRASTAAEPGRCTGVIEAVVVPDVVVPAGATCTLVGTQVDGNVRVGPGATLLASGVTVDGDVEGERAAGVEVTEASRIGGDVQLQQDGGWATLRDVTIDGDVEWEGQGGALHAEGNTIGGNLQADDNRGGVHLAGNRIDGDLECEHNDPAPGGSGNAVGGDTEEQCAAM